MHVTFLGHAQLLIESNGKRLLLDPWFAEPVFGGAWWRYPPPPYPTPASLGAIDALALSHIHPDHSGPDTLAQLDARIPTAIMPFRSGSLTRRLQQAGYSDVRIIEPWQRHTIAAGIDILFVPHHRGWEVSSIIIETGGVRVYHGNDNPLSVEAYAEVAKRVGPCDIAFFPFAGASSYPTGFGWQGDALAERCEQKKQQGIKRFTDGIEGLEPKQAVPFASSWALLEEDELWKNYLDRPTPPQAIAAAADAARAAGCQATLMDPGDVWRPGGEIQRKGMTAGWGYDPDSVARYAQQRRDDVQAEVDKRRGGCRAAPSAQQLDGAFRMYFAAMLEGTRDTTRELSMRASFVADGDGGGATWSIVFEPGIEPELLGGPLDDADETLTLDAAELWTLLTSSSNWEDPWYGYRLRVRKRSGAGYYRAFWEMLLNFDDQELSQQVARAFADPSHDRSGSADPASA